MSLNDFPLIQPEVQNYLEAVYAISPFPEKYVLYRLHLSTSLPLTVLDEWFNKRRSNSKDSQIGICLSESSVPNLGTVEEASFEKETIKNHFVANKICRKSSSVETSSDCKVLRDESTKLTKNQVNLARFTEQDLELVCRLIGLQKISTCDSTDGSHLYMFEQLTALDSLDNSCSSQKRKRMRHQHFWRNTDKLEPTDRKYVSTTSLNRALKENIPVSAKSKILPEERTNLWTVCLTSCGVISYLNRRISPLGVRLFRGLLQELESSDSRALKLSDK